MPSATQFAERDATSDEDKFLGVTYEFIVDILFDFILFFVINFFRNILLVLCRRVVTLLNIMT